MITHDTTELSLTFAITAFGMPTRAAPLRGVCSRDKPNQYTTKLRLVTDELPQLSEGPIAVPCSLRRPFNPRPRSDALEVFKCNRPLRAFGLPNKLLANNVIYVFLKALLATCQFLQPTFG